MGAFASDPGYARLDSPAPGTDRRHPAAREGIAARGAPVMFVQSGGCCAGGTPMCFPLGDFIVGDVDVLGDIDGSPFYIDKRLDEAWHQDVFMLDAADGEPARGLLTGGRQEPPLRHALARPRHAGTPRTPGTP